MSEKGIIFSPPMVRALLAGTKTQTRRIAKPRAGLTLGELISGGHVVPDGYHVSKEQLAPPPYKVGDRLYVREAFSYDTLDVDRDGTLSPWYWADGNMADSEQGSGNFTKPKPSIHMPRWASRLTLTVSDVRVQRVQEIDRADAIAEGLIHKAGVIEPDWWMLPEPLHQGTWLSPVAAYGFLWDSLHTRPGDRWEDNPFVVAVSFTVEQRNIDAGAA